MVYISFVSREYHHFFLVSLLLSGFDKCGDDGDVVEDVDAGVDEDEEDDEDDEEDDEDEDEDEGEFEDEGVGGLFLICASSFF